MAASVGLHLIGAFKNRNWEERVFRAGKVVAVRCILSAESVSHFAYAWIGLLYSDLRVRGCDCVRFYVGPR